MFLVSALWGLAASCLIWAVAGNASRRRARSRITQLSVPSDNVGAPDAQHWGPRLPGLGRALVRWRPGEARHAAMLLDQSGLSGTIAPATFMILKAVGGLLGLVLAAALHPLLPPNRPASTLFLAPLLLLGWFAPELYLLQRRRGYRASVARSLPTFVDLLTMSMDAGMGLERALRLISERADTPVSGEIRRVLADIDLGLSRRDAFRRMALRVSLEEVHALTGAIIQSEELGTNLTSSLKMNAAELRLTRRRAAEAAAMRAPIKMVFPMVLFLLPALGLVLLGPVIIQMLEQ
jgi:tight adherence protein C